MYYQAFPSFPLHTIPVPVLSEHRTSETAQPQSRGNVASPMSTPNHSTGGNTSCQPRFPSHGPE